MEQERPTTTHAITQLLVEMGNGNDAAMKELLPLVYRELRRLAASYLRKEAPGTLQPTALVHEAYFKLIDQDRIQWKNRSQFFAISAQMMRRILIDQARARLAEKRGGDATKVSFDEQLHFQPQDAGGLVALDQALTELAALDERKARVVELRFFAGLSVEETASALETSEATIKRDWAFAKAWLAERLTGE
jgi:RNA polymerase sigma-70 factor, ECF subfamily